MISKQFEFQPGAMPHEAIVGTFRAHGGSFERWCQENAISPSNARNATFGQSRGPKREALLKRIIDDAGRDFVMKAYEKCILDYAASLNRGAA